MREIKFRAWDSVANRLFPIDNASFTSGILNRVNLWHVDPFGDKRIKLMQYTGLKDRDGTEIYEGDIVKYLGNKFFYPIAWNDGRSCFGFGGDGRYFRPFFEMNGGSEFEVIGNVWENPELLK